MTSPCPTGFSTRATARAAARAIASQGHALRLVYRCIVCDRWHVGYPDDVARAKDGRMYATFAQRRRNQG